MKLGQILVCCIKSISNMFLAQHWRLETSSRHLYDFIKITIWHDLAIFNSWHLPFLIVLIHVYKKVKHWNLNITGYWVIGAGCLIEMTWNLALQIVLKIPEIIAIAYIYQIAKFGDLMSCGSKDIFRNVPCLMY